MDKRIDYRADIDGLRAVAIVSVMAFHAFPKVLGGGFVGVDIFFVISGYLIATILQSEIALGTFSVLAFYRRRIARLFPALLVVLGGCMLIGYVDLFDVELRQLSWHTLYGALGLANISLLQDVGYFAPAAELNPLLHLWSLGVEEQFYLVFPLLMLVTKARATIRVPLFVGLFSLSLFLSIDVWQWFSKASKFYLPQFRAWELLAGVILAQRDIRKASAISFRGANMASFVGCALVLWGLLKVNGQDSAWAASIAAVAGTVLLISAGQRAWVNRHVLSGKPLVFIGLVSYPLYLWHWPLLSMQRLLYPAAGDVGKSVFLLIAFILSVATWRFVERPMRTIQYRNLKVGALLASMALVWSVSAFAYVHNGRVGWAQSLDDLAFEATDGTPARFGQCAQKYLGVPAGNGVLVDCSDAGSGKLASAVLVGNSHARQLFSGAESYYRKRGESILSLTMDGCALFGDPNRSSDCSRGYMRILSEIENMPNINTVILAEYVPYMTGNNRPNWAQEARSTVQRLSDRGKRVVLMIDNPSLDLSPRQVCYSRRFPKASEAQLNERCSIARSIYDERVKDYRPEAQKVVAGIRNVLVHDLARHLCDADRCHGMVGGTVLYRDDNHVNHSGALYLSTFFDWEPPINVPAAQ